MGGRVRAQAGRQGIGAWRLGASRGCVGRGTLSGAVTTIVLLVSLFAYSAAQAASTTTYPIPAPTPGISQTPAVGSVSTGPGTATTTVSCPTGAQSCPISVSLSVVQRGGQVSAARKVKPRTVIVGSKAVMLASGQSQKITVVLNAAGRKLLALHKHLSALLKVSTGATVLKTQKVQIKPLASGKRRG
jgi:hypothetical protein